MARRKKTISAQSEAAAQNQEGRVNQVVEIVEETSPVEELETIKKDAEEISEVASNLEDVSLHEQDSRATTAALASEPHEETSKEQDETQKEVVSELFEKDSSMVPSEITTGAGSSGRNLMVWALIVIGVAILVGGGLIFAVKGGVGTFAPAPTPTPTVSPTPVPTVKREELRIQVLNGGGVPGAAAKMKAFLEEKGYTVSDVGNASEYTFEKTEVLVKKDKEAYLSLLTDDLQGTYTIGTAAATLVDSVSFDARVAVGKE